MTKPEIKSGDDSNRMWASASFVGVLIVIGLPLWWKTTEVYRVPLPYDKINSFDPLDHAVTTELNVLANDEATASVIADAIQKSFKDSDVITFKINKAVLPDTLQKVLESVTDEQEALEEVAASFQMKRNSFYVVQRTPLFKNVWLAGERVAFFRDGKASATLVEALHEWVYQPRVLSGARSVTPDAARRTRFPPSAAYRILLSVVQPSYGARQFDVRHALEDYVGTFVDELSNLHNFTLKSQFLHLPQFGTKVKDDSELGHHFAVKVDQLPLLLTKLEERAATQVSELPTINLALYVVPCEEAPLLIYDHNDKTIPSTEQAFMSPKWGGVVLASPGAACEGAPPPPAVGRIMGAFLSHLRKLLGITATEPIEGAHLEPLRSVIPRTWEVDSLLRIRTLEQLSSAERTLQSLARLLGTISNIVINDEVGASINAAVEGIARAQVLIDAGHLEEAYETSLKAFEAAETAFMEPSLLALLYFPDDQKYAIYIPLFLPIMFPVVLSLKNLLLWFRGKPAQKEKAE